MAGITPTDIVQMQQGTPKEWFYQTAKIADFVYKVTPKGDISAYRYIYNYSHILEEQLTLAGYRLAYVLNMIFD
jgi:hypothetical protein